MCVCVCVCVCMHVASWREWQAVWRCAYSVDGIISNGRGSGVSNYLFAQQTWKNVLFFEKEIAKIFCFWTEVWSLTDLEDWNFSFITHPLKHVRFFFFRSFIELWILELNDKNARNVWQRENISLSDANVQSSMKWRKSKGGQTNLQNHNFLTALTWCKNIFGTNEFSQRIVKEFYELVPCVSSPFLVSGVCECCSIRHQMTNSVGLIN